MVQTSIFPKRNRGEKNGDNMPAIVAGTAIKNIINRCRQLR